MRLTRLAWLIILSLGGSLGIGAQSPNTLFDVPELLREAQRNGEAMGTRTFNYSWASKTLLRRFNTRGRVTKEIVQEHEVYPAHGLTHVVKKLVRENGLPLSPKRAAKEQKRLDAELESADIALTLFSESSMSGEDATGCPSFGVWTVLNGSDGKEISLGVSDFLCYGEFSSLRLESRNGRDAVALRFRPRAKLTTLDYDKVPFAKMVGVIWIDLKDKVVTRIEACSAESSHSAIGQHPSCAEATIIFEDMRLPDGMWVRGLRHIKTMNAPLAFNGLKVEWKQEFTDYVRYDVRDQGYTPAESKQSQPQL